MNFEYIEDMLHLRISNVVLLLLISMAALARADESGDNDLPPPGMVRVEQDDLLPPTPPDKDFRMKPYSERRSKWGFILGVDYSTYQPTNYAPAFTFQSFGDLYGQPQTPLIEAQIVIKRNFSFGSIGVEIGYGNYDNLSDNAQVDSELKLQQIRLGVIFILDTLMSQPYVAPYGSFGGYVMQFDESVANNDFTGNTQIAPYLTVGVMSALDWLDPEGAKLAYKSGRVQGTFLFAEVRSYFASSNSTDPQFNSSFVPGGGLRIEF